MFSIRFQKLNMPVKTAIHLYGLPVLLSVLLTLIIGSYLFHNLPASQKNRTMNITRQNYANLPQPVGPYVHAVKHNNTLYLSGLTASTETALAGTIEQQTRDVFNQIENIAKVENVTLADLLKVTIYVTDLKDMHKLRDTLFEIYRENLPASTLVEVNALFLPEIKIEVSAVLAVH